MSNEKFTPGPWHGPEEKPLRNGYCAMRYQRLHSGRRWVFVSAQTIREIQRSAKADFPTKWLYNWHVSGLFTVISWAYVRDLERLGIVEKTPAELAVGEMADVLQNNGRM